MSGSELIEVCQIHEMPGVTEDAADFDHGNA